MEMDDLVKMKMLGDKNSFTPYEQMKLQQMHSRRPSGVAIAGLTVGIGAAVAAIGVGAWAGAKASEARRVAAADNEKTAALLRMAVEQSRVEHQERVQGDITLNATINDTVSGTQSNQQTVSQEVVQQVVTGLMTGRYSENPLKVVRVSGQRECPCDGCGCNG